MSNPIYLDNAATTRLHPDVLAAMMPYLTDIYGNPSSVHSFGRQARQAVDEARAKVAKAIGAEPGEIIFTGGGTESDNIAIVGASRKLRRKGAHLVTSSIEHPAALRTFEALEKEGFSVSYLPVNADGIVQPDALRNVMRGDTILVSVMTANNEIGTIQPIRELAAIAHEYGAVFHTDAVQAVGSIPMNVKELGVDMLTLSAHKFHGPKGVGVLYIRKGVSVEPLTRGGAHERAIRPGTENVPGIVGLGAAIERATANIEEKGEKIRVLRDMLIDGLLGRIPYSQLNGDRTQRLPGNVNISIHCVEGESLLLSLDMAGVAASSGSACASGSLDPSHVLLALGLTHEVAHGSLRLSLSDETTRDEILRVIEILPGIVEKLRAMSPVWEDMITLSSR